MKLPGIKILREIGPESLALQGKQVVQLSIDEILFEKDQPNKFNVIFHTRSVSIVSYLDTTDLISDLPNEVLKKIASDITKEFERRGLL